MTGLKMMLELVECAILDADGSVTEVARDGCGWGAEVDMMCPDRREFLDCSIRPQQRLTPVEVLRLFDLLFLL